jgi:metallo-beta-lactamase family protein
VFDQTDYLVMESTYGDRDHDVEEDVATQIARTITETVARGGNVVVPTFAIERAQELLYHLGRLSEAGRIPRTPVYLDSPMAVEVTRLVDRHVECFDEETRQLIAAGRQPLRFPGLKLSSTTEESKAINHRREPAVILAPSGMCTAGRIKHHLAHNLPRSECTVLFVGYQAAGTLGRQILEGAREVRIHGRMWPVRARVAVVRGFSGHADRAALLRWLGAFRSPPRGVFLTHGEEQSSLALAAHVAEQLHWPVLVPEYGQAVELEG